MGEPANPAEAAMPVDGTPRAEPPGGRAAVRQIIGGLFTRNQRAGAGDCRLPARDGPVPGPASVPEDDGIPGGPVPALAKNDGGGGAWSGR